MELHAKVTLFAEGARGSLTKTLFKKYNLQYKPDSNYHATTQLSQLIPANYYATATAYTS